MPKTHFLILFLLTAIACSPLFVPGLYTSPDGENHLVRLAWFSHQLSRGELYPRWLPSLNYGLGLPIFTFIYPLPYYLASIPALLGLSLVDSLKTTLFVATLSSVAFFYLWMSRLFPSRVYPLAASTLFIFTPYRFTNLFVRLALGEVIFLAVIPAVFAALESRHLRLSALALTAAILSHLQLAAVFLPIIVIYGLIRRLPIIKPIVFGLLLSAFFWMPALWLKQYTFFDSLRQFPPTDHLPTLRQLIYSPWGFGFSRPGLADDMSFQLGLVNWAVLGLSTILFFKLNRVFKLAVLICWLAVLVMFSSPFGLWNLSILAPVQFPWRLLNIPLIFSPLLLTPVRPRLLVAVVLALAVYANRNHIRTNLPQFVNTPDSAFLRTDTTTTATPKEFMPIIYDSRTQWLFTSSPAILLSGAVSVVAAGTIMLWHRHLTWPRSPSA